MPGREGSGWAWQRPGTSRLFPAVISSNYSYNRMGVAGRDPPPEPQLVDVL